MKKDNGPVMFLHDKKLVKQYKSNLRLLFPILYLYVILGVPLYLFLYSRGMKFEIFMFVAVPVAAISLLILHALCTHVLNLLEFFQDDYIKNHPELPKDSSMLER